MSSTDYSNGRTPNRRSPSSFPSSPMVSSPSAGPNPKASSVFLETGMESQTSNFGSTEVIIPLRVLVIRVSLHL